MNIHPVKAIAIACIGAMLLNACSNGGTEGTGVDKKDNAISFGTVTKLGSAYVNDVHYVTANAKITIDDNPGTESDIKVGQVVVVSGSIDDNGVDGTASSVTIDSVVKGPVDSVYNATSRELGVLGQTVQVTDLTVIDDSIGSLNTLALNNEVKIHGHIRGPGLIEATLIEKSNAALTEYKIIGIAQSITATGFSIGSLNIDYSGAIPTSGQLVEVKGMPPLSSGTLIATKVEAAGITSSSNNANYVEIEGFVTDLTNPVTPISFTLGNVPVLTSNTTKYEGGLPADVSVGIKLEVDGQLSNGTLIASKVQFRYNIKIEANVNSFDGSTLTIVGLNGITVNVDGLTEVNSTPVVGNEVRLRGYKTSNGVVTATRIEDRGSASNRAILQAPVENEVTGTSFNLLSLTVNTTAAGFEFRDISESPLTSDAFYNLVDPGTLVKARGDYNGVSVDWNRAEIED